jgi:ribosome biogenesis GTPase
MHIHEPDCAVKEAVEQGEIHRSRYENYVLLAEELKNRKRY